MDFTTFMSTKQGTMSTIWSDPAGILKSATLRMGNKHSTTRPQPFEIIKTHMKKTQDD